jgi:hypothetical protein
MGASGNLAKRKNLHRTNSGVWILFRSSDSSISVKKMFFCLMVHEDYATFVRNLNEK